MFMAIGGGKRPNISVVIDDTLDCLLSLVLDFPTMSAANNTEYLNSNYGPNHDNPISLRTVYTCLTMMKLTVKKVSFAHLIEILLGYVYLEWQVANS